MNEYQFNGSPFGLPKISTGAGAAKLNTSAQKCSQEVLARF